MKLSKILLKKKMDTKRNLDAENINLRAKLHSDKSDIFQKKKMSQEFHK